MFERCVSDLTESNQNQRPHIERWWDAIKKVIRLHRSSTHTQQEKYVKGANAIEVDVDGDEILNDEIQHFYLVLKNEEPTHSFMKWSEEETARR